MNEDDAEELWLMLADKMFKVICDIVNAAEIPVGPKGFNDPKAISVTLLLRTLSNFRSAILLIRQGLVVEARTIVRCCIENLLWLGKLRDKGDEFVKEIHQDEAGSQNKRHKIIKYRGLSQNLDALDETLSTFHKQWPKAKILQVSQVARDNTIGDLELFYSQLSGDAAHPSLTALSRYIVKNDKMWGFDASPKQAYSREKILTIYYACIALHGSGVAFNEIIKAKADKQLIEIGKEFLILRDSQALNEVPLSTL